MEPPTEHPQRFTSPPVEPTGAQPHHPLSKATVTSANVASVGETTLATSASGIMSADHPHPHHPPTASTPRRRPSFREQQQPTPRGSLQWPSTHRSFSSAAATRDSSRHSQVTDRANAGGANASRHGRAASSTCRTPMSSRDDHSDQRSSVFSGAGGHHGDTRRPHSSAPPLVDVGDSPSQGPQSASHSVYTTGLCTPRETAAAAGGGGGGEKAAVAHGRHPSPFPLSSHLSGTVSVGQRAIVTPAPPPLEDFEAEALALTRAELEERVEQMRGDSVILRTSVLRLRESLAALQEGMRANYADIERRQDSIANTLLRRLEATKRHRAKLVAHLRSVEQEKATRESQLQATKESIKDLSKHLKREEQEIANRLQRRLERLHQQREQLDRVLAEQTDSLQQLEQLVREVEEMDTSDAAADAAAGPHLSAQLLSATATTNAAAAAVPASPSVLAAAEDAVNTSASLSAPLSAPPAAPASLAQAGASLSVPHVHERSSSRVSVASSTAGTATTTTADVAYDPTAMIRYLQAEIAAAEGLRAEALSKADEYVATRERLERRLKREREQRAAQESRTEALRRELRSASTAANERVAAQEVALEMEVERHLNTSRLGGDIVSSASSTCATPKLRAISAVASRGNSVSPSAGRLATGGGGGGEGRSAVADSFLLPSSSGVSSAPPAASAHHSDAHSHAGAAGPLHAFAVPAPLSPPSGHVVAGDGGPAMRRPSSASLPHHTSASRDETTASSESTPHTTRLLVQDTSRMAAPRPVTSPESTPKRTPLATPQMSLTHEPAA